MTETTTTVQPGNGHDAEKSEAERQAEAMTAIAKAREAETKAKVAKPARKPAAANPLKALEKAAGKAVTNASAKPVQGKPAAASGRNAKAAAKAAQPVVVPNIPKTRGTYTRRFARVFQSMLGSHGYELTIPKDEKLVIFENKSAQVRVEIDNPNKQWASKTAPWKAMKKGKPFSQGAGRDALAKQLGIPAYGRN